MVVVATYADRRRARRMRDWLVRAYIPARLTPRDDGRLDLLVAADEQDRAVDLLLTLVWGLDIGHMRPLPAADRYRVAENVLSGAGAALGAALLTMVLLMVVPALAVTAVVPLLALVGAAAFVAVASAPGGPSRERPAPIPGIHRI